MPGIRSLAVGLLSLALFSFPARGADAVPAPAPAASTIQFNRDVRPILSENCYYCHGPDSAHRKEGLRLDRKEGLFGPREHGPAVAPDKPGDSQLFKHVTSTDPDERMPPAKTGKTLSDAQKQMLRRWIEQGATWEQQWSLVPPSRPALPQVKNAKWARNPIDAFVLARLEADGLEPAPQADRPTLIRRVSLDLIGLAPTPAEVEAFVNDKSADAYAKVVDRLLASPRYGEHRARYWLDAARYGDTHGIHNDNYVELWPYRDWVINAFNHNEPFDQFTIDQIAGDLIPHHTLDQEIATGFHRCNATTGELGSIDDEVLAMYARDRAQTTGAVWLGLTVGCAVCHDHKFDPISQKEFYQLTAFFRNTPQPALDGNLKDTPPVVVVPGEKDRPLWEAAQKSVAEMEPRREKLKKEASAAFAAWLKADARSLGEPLDPAGQHLSLPLDAGDGERVAMRIDGCDESAALSAGLTWGDGPHGDNAIHFGPKASLQLDAAGFDASHAFSLGAWVFVPKADGKFAVASQLDPKAKGAGWVLDIENRALGLRLIGADPRKPLQARAAKPRLQAGKWSHVFATYDGSGGADGVVLYINGKPQYNEAAGEAVIAGTTDPAIPLRIGSDGARDFNGGAVGDFRIYSRALVPEEVRAVAKWAGLQKALARVDAKLTGPQRDELLNLYLVRFDEPYRQTSIALAKAQADERIIRRRSPIALVMAEKPNSVPTAHVLFRGQYDQPREEVHAATPAALNPFPKGAPHNRLGLAQWLVDPANPLTARVTINRMWQEIFGQGIVRTTGDFGIMGENPSHPQLLDWLAVEFMNPSIVADGMADDAPAGGRVAASQDSSKPAGHHLKAWDIKRMLRLIVTSATYRQSASASPEKLARDLDNRLMSRGPRFRMDAEELRDYALAAGGLLSPRIGGASVRPYQPPGVWEAVAMSGSNTRFYKQDAGESLYRRSLYTFWKRSAPPASMDIFNAPSRIECTVRRERTDTPLQALVTMNDPQWVEAARCLAQRAMKEAGNDFDHRLDFITMHVISREFDLNERSICRASLDGFLKTYRADAAAAKSLIATGDSTPDATVPPADLAAWTLLASQVMNTDEALNK